MSRHSTPFQVTRQEKMAKCFNDENAFNAHDFLLLFGKTKVVHAS